MSTRAAIVAGMVTRIHKHQRPRLFLKEHREAKLLTAKQLADRLNMHEKSVYRIEAEPWRLNTDEKRQGWAESLGLDHWQRLTRPPGQPERPSLDAIVADQPDDIVEMARDIVTRLVAGRR